MNSPWRDASNGGNLTALASMEEELYQRKHLKENFNMLCIDAIDLKPPSFDAPRRDEFNGGNFVFLQSLDSEQLYFKSLLEFWSFENFFELRNWFWKATLE